MSWSSTTCRSCLTDALQDVFEFDIPCYFSPDDLTFLEVFNVCTHLEISAHDGLPQIICGDCVKDLQNVYNFQQKVLKTNQELMKLKQSENTNETRHDTIKDPLENVTDAEDSDEEQV